MFISVLISVNAECITTEIYGTTWRLECKIFGEIQTLISVSLKAGKCSLWDLHKALIERTFCRKLWGKPLIYDRATNSIYCLCIWDIKS